MQSDALDLIYNSDRIPKISPLIGEGVAYHQLVDLHKSIDLHMRTLLMPENEDGLPEGFTYLRCELLNPLDEYLERGKRKNKQSQRQTNAEGFQYLPTDTYYVRYHFKNGDQHITREGQVLFSRRGGITQLRGTKYSISAVLKTRGVSVTPKGYFISFDSNQVNIERESRSFLANGTPKHYYLPIANDLNRHTKKGSKSFRPPLVGWLFAKYGVYEAFKRFLDIDVQIFEDNDPKLLEFDTNEYSVCRSLLPFKGEKSARFAVVIPKDKMSHEAEIFVGTMFYIAIHYGDMLSVEAMDSVLRWKLLLGYAMHGEDEYNVTMHQVMVDKHLSNVEKYLDNVFRHQLLHEGLEFEDIYDFFFHIVRLHTQDAPQIGKLANAWGRYLTCSEYVLVGLRHSIRKCMWDLKDAAKDTATGMTGLPVSKRRVESIINRYISADALTNISVGHGEVAPLQVTSDNMLIGVTSRAIDESDAKKSQGAGKKVVDLNDPTKHIHASWIEVGSVANLPKSYPFGLGVLNPYLEVDMYWKIVRKEENRGIMARAHADLRQKGHAI